MALLEHGRITMVAVRVASLVAFDVCADYGCRLHRRLANRIGSVARDADVLLRKSPAGGCHGRRYG